MCKYIIIKIMVFPSYDNILSIKSVSQSESHSPNGSTEASSEGYKNGMITNMLNYLQPSNVTLNYKHTIL
jgi:hypothetical protein